MAVAVAVAVQALQRWAVNEVIGPSIDECAAVAAPSAAAIAGGDGCCQPWWLAADAGDDVDDGTGFLTSTVMQELLAVREQLLKPAATAGHAVRWVVRREEVGACVWGARRVCSGGGYMFGREGGGACARAEVVTGGGGMCGLEL